MEGQEIVLSTLNHKILKKTILKQGVYSMGCNDGFKCHFQISDISYLDERGDEVPPEQRMQLLREDGVHEVLIGGAPSHIHLDFYRILKHMFCNETSIVTLQYNNEDDVMKLKITAKIHIMKMYPFIDENLSAVVCDWNWKNKLEIALMYKQDGVDSMKTDVVLAFRAFGKALKLLLTLGQSELDEIPEDDRKIINDHKVKLYNNLALCQLRYRRYDAVLNLCNKALALDPQNEKSLFRRGVAYSELKEYEAAYEDILNVLRMSPDNVDAKRIAVELREKVKLINDVYKKVIRNMFNK